MRIKTITLLSVLLSGLFLSHSDADNRAATRFEAASAAGALAVLEFAASPLVAMTVIPFRIEVKNADGTPLTDAAVSCELTMPSMPMPENRPVVMAHDGAYRGEIIFTCTQGAWRFTCTASGGKEPPQTFAFDLPRVRMK